MLKIKEKIGIGAINPKGLIKNNHEEKSYLNLIENILQNGSLRQDRTKIGTLSIFGSNLRFSLKNNTLPMLTTKKMFSKGVIEELLFFIRGDTDTKKLEEKGVNIWKGNTSREFLDSRKLFHIKDGDMGKGYGYQWRNFGAVDVGHQTYRGVDQLPGVIDSIKNDPYGRRHIITAWNPNDLNEVSLPPCHILVQFYVDNGELSSQFYMRSVDTFLGLPFNIMSYAILTHLIAKATNLKAKEIVFCGGDTHIYSNHIEQVKEQITREPFDFPQITINKEINSIHDMENLSFNDFVISNYICHPTIKAEMAI